MGAMGAAMGSTAAGHLERADVLMVVVLGGITFAEVAMLEQLMVDTNKQVCINSEVLIAFQCF